MARPPSRPNQWLVLGLPPTAPFSSGPTTTPVEDPVNDPSYGDACKTPAGADGILARDVVANALVCAVPLSQAAVGDVCVVPGTASFVPVAGVVYDLGGPGRQYCVDESQMDTAWYDACTKTPLPDGTLPPPQICAVVASNKAHQTSDLGQSVGYVVADKSLCASNTVYSFTANGETVLVCTEAPQSSGPQQGDPCDASGLAGKMLPGYGGNLVCIANQGQDCATKSGAPGTTDGLGNCAAKALPPGSRCSLPDGTTGVVAVELPNDCVAVGQACKQGVIDSKGACVAVTPKPGDACALPDGSAGVVATSGACAKVPPQPKPGDACALPDGSAGVVVASGACARAPVEPAPVEPAPVEPESTTPSRSSILPWLVGLGLLVGVWYVSSAESKGQR